MGQGRTQQSTGAEPTDEKSLDTKWELIKAEVPAVWKLRLKLYAKKVGVRRGAEAIRVALEREFQKAGV
jgi:hypothetical protein